MAISTVQAQPRVEWSRSYGGPQGEEPASIVQLRDGGYAFASGTTSFGPGQGQANFWLLKVDEQGDSVWSNAYGGNEREYFNSFVQTTDGGFALAGGTQSFGAGGYDFWLVKTDENGDSLWSRTYGGNSVDICFSVIQTQNGGFALAGFTSSFGAGGPDFWLVKTDANGDSIWSMTFGGEFYDECYSLIEAREGGFALGGFTANVRGDEADFMIVRCDERGDTLWTHKYGGDGEEWCYSLAQTGDGGIVAAGSTESWGSGGYDFLLVKYDSRGRHLWAHTFGGEQDENCRSVIQADDGGLALAGSTYSWRRGWRDFWLLKTDGNGDSLWSRPFEINSGNFSKSCIQTIDHSFALAGHISREGYDVFVIKTTHDPHPPSRFDLSRPQNRDTLLFSEVEFVWNESVDSDVEDTLFYRLWIKCGADSISFESSLPELLLDLDSTLIRGENDSRIEWWLEAISDQDTLECNSRFHFYLNSNEVKTNTPFLPAQFILFAPFPNPFNSSTTVTVTLPRSEDVKVNLVDISGKVILTKSFGRLETGSHNLTISAENVPSGLYFIQTTLVGKKLMKSVVLMK